LGRGFTFLCLPLALDINATATADSSTVSSPATRTETPVGMTGRFFIVWGRFGHVRLLIAISAEPGEFCERSGDAARHLKSRGEGRIL
jgi:hypothetical protein